MKQRKQNFCIPSHSSLGSPYARHLLLTIMAVLVISFLTAYSNSAQADDSKHNQPDISQSGQFQYGCALVIHLSQTHQGINDWRSIPNPGSGINQIYAIGGLFHSAIPPSDNKNGLPKTGRRILKGTATRDLESLVKALNAAMTQCKNLTDSTSQVDSSKQNQSDISRLGQIQYGCALVKYLNHTYQSKDDWSILSSSTGLNQIHAIVGLFHSFPFSDNKNGLPEIGRRLYKDAADYNVEDLVKAMNAAMAKCKSMKDRTNKNDGLLFLYKHILCYEDIGIVTRLMPVECTRFTFVQPQADGLQLL